MVERLLHAFAAEAIERPEEHQVELPLAGVLEQALELLSVGMLAGGAVDVLVDDGPVLGSGERAQLGELVLAVLLAVLLETLAYRAIRFILLVCF